MKKNLTILVAATALTAAIGLPAWSAMRPLADESREPTAARFEDGAQAGRFVLAGGETGDREHHVRKGSQRGHDDVEDDDDDDDDDGRGSRGGAGNPAPMGTVAPPRNGLFGTGAPPQVQVN